MANFLIGIIVSIATGVAFAASSILTRVGAKKFRGHLAPKIKQNIFFGAQLALLNTFFILGIIVSIFGTVGKLAAPLIGNTTISITIIYSSSYIATILLGDMFLKEKISIQEFAAVLLLIFSIILVSIGVLTAGGGL